MVAAWLVLGGGEREAGVGRAGRGEIADLAADGVGDGSAFADA